MKSARITLGLSTFALLLALAIPALAVPAAGPAAQAQSTKRTDQVRGFSMQLSDSTDAGTEHYLQAIDELADLGCNWINFSIAARQYDIHAEEVRINAATMPAQPNLERILRHAKERHMGVMLMPIVLLDNSGSKDWRGVIDPPNWDNWFATYTNFITQEARIARVCDVDIFCVGSELLSTESFRDRWVDTIGQIRKEYSGKLTYSANWDHYDHVTFWDQLDYIGMNNYNELWDKPGATVPQLLTRWEPIKKKILAFAAEKKKPFMFTEVGWHNLVNTISEPWNYVAEGNIDLNEQLHAYQSFVQTWQNVPHDQFMGAFIWEWSPGVDGATNHGSYSLKGTPALEVVKKWFASP